MRSRVIDFLSILPAFYSRLLWPSLLINLAMLLLSFPLSIAVIVKAVLSLCLYLSYRFWGKGEKGTFYNNLGWRISCLIGAVFLLDVLITTLIFQIHLIL